MRIISGILKGRVIKTVDGPGYRPAMGRVREALFSILEARGVIWAESPVLDLFAGSGALAFEALSRGAPVAHLVENAPIAARCLRENARTLGLDNTRCRIVQADVSATLNTIPAAPFAVVFIDPPYNTTALPRIAHTLIRRAWLTPWSFVVAEVEARAVFDATTVHPQLTVLTERFFGQTRIIVWTPQATAVPSSPVLLTH